MTARGPWRWLMVTLLGVGVLLCAAALSHGLSAGKIGIEYSPRPVLGVLLSATLAVTSANWLWCRLVRIGAGVAVGWRQSLIGLSALLIGKYIPGKVFGLVGRVATVADLVGARRASALALLEQGMVLLGLSLVGAVAWFYSRPNALLSAFTALLVLALVAAPGAVGLLMLERSVRWPLAHSALQVVAKFTPTQNVLLMAGAALAAGGTLLMAVFVPELLGMSLTAREAALLVATYALAIVAGMLAIVMPAGIGAREAVFILLAQPVMTVEQATAVAAALRLLNVGVDAVIGLLGLMLLKLDRR